MAAGDPILETARLRLRELTADDLDFTAMMLAHPEVSRSYERQFTRADAATWLARQQERYRRDGHGLWLVEDRLTREPLGQAGLAWQEVEGHRHPEIGWLLARHAWGCGYATEAAAAVRDAACTRWRYPRVISLIRPVNVASRRVAERIGLAPGPEVDFHGFRHVMYQLAFGDGPATPGRGP